MPKAQKKIADPEIAKRLKETIASRGWKQAELAREIDYSNNAISNLVNGYNRLTPELAEKLAMILDVTPEYLLGTSEHMTKWTKDLHDDINQRNIECYKYYLPPNITIVYDPKAEAYRLVDEKSKEVRLATKAQLDDFYKYIKKQISTTQKLFWDILEYQIVIPKSKEGDTDGSE